ncbi:hypothetical protein AB0M29_15140 [Streptomyces sp. NPDC051976]|uniref:effector-associated constant component EACC1 n=1 Tax=Streptomyces sp. NPDC051976 TaxID=3154947 RepID=UPI00343FE0F6
MTVELRVHLTDGGQLADLREWMGGHPGVAVRAVGRKPDRNSQGTAWDFLSVACAAGGPLVAAVRALQLWIEAQVTEIEVEVGGRRIKVTGRTAGTVLPQVIEAARALEAGAGTGPGPATGAGAGAGGTEGADEPA